MEREIEIIREDENIFRMNFSKKTEGVSTIGLVSDSTWGETNIKISSQMCYFTDDGLCKRTVFYKFHDEDIVGFSPDNICGKNYQFDNLGRVVSESFLTQDLHGNFIEYENSQGISKIKYEYLDSGYLFKVKYYDLMENLVTQKNDFGSFTTIKVEYDNVGNINKTEYYLYDNLIGLTLFHRNKDGLIDCRCFFGEEGVPLYIAGAHKICYEYDKRNNLTHVSYYDEQNNNIYCNSVANYTYKYDISDKIIEEKQYGINNQEIETNTATIIKLKYDINNNITEKEFYNYNYDYAPENKIGCSIEKRIYNKKNELIECRYYDNKKALFNDIHGVAIYKYAYDKLGNLIETNFYDKYEAKTLYDGLYSSIKSNYNEKGLITKRIIYDMDDNIMKYSDGKIPITIFEYDNKGNNTTIKYFDENEKFISGEKKEFDQIGRITIWDSVDENNNLNPYDGVARIVYDYTNDYEQATLYGKDNNPVMGAYNYWMTRTYKKNGNIIREEYFDLDSKLCCSLDGYAIKEMIYDIKGNRVFIGYYDKESQPIDYIFKDGSSFAYSFYNPEDDYRPVYYNKYGQEIVNIEVPYVNGIFYDSQAANSEIELYDFIVEWNTWKYDPNQPDYSALMEEMSLTEDKRKTLKLYNSRKDKIYSCDFDKGRIGISIEKGWTPALNFLTQYERVFNIHTEVTFINHKTVMEVKEYAEGILLKQNQKYNEKMNQ